MEEIILVKILENNKREQKEYTRIDELGSGAYGKVYKIKDIKTDEIKALKVLEKEDFFKQKINIVKTINSTKSPYIIKMLDYGNEIINLKQNEPSKNNFVVYEYAKKGALINYLIIPVNYPFQESYAKILFKNIIKGIKAMHDVNICHRDIKLSNILLDDDYMPKIADFGFSIYCKKELHDKAGTKLYCGPEIYGKNYDGKKADIFSLGVTLLKLVCGFDILAKENNYYEILNNIDEFYEKFKINLSPMVRTLIKKMVRTNPLERPDIHQVLNDPWLNDFQENDKELLIQYRNEFIKRDEKIKNTNNEKVIEVEKKDDFQNYNKSMSTNFEEDDYKEDFELKIIDDDDENVSLKDFIIIKGEIEPKDYMNFIKRLLKTDYADYINNVIKNKNKNGKFFFKRSKYYYKFKVGIEYDNDNDNDKTSEEDNDEFTDTKMFFKKGNLLIRGVLLQSRNGYYILRFYKKSGDTEEYYEILNKMVSIL